MRHFTLLASFLLLCLGMMVRLPSGVQQAAAIAPTVQPQWEKMTLQPLPEAPQITNAAADSCSNATEVTLNSAGWGDSTVVNSMTEDAEGRF